MHTWHRAMDDTGIASEKSAEFGDGIGDPELEARLYAEIYFSNETYEGDQGAEQTVSESLSASENVTPSLSKETSDTPADNLNTNTVPIKTNTGQGNFGTKNTRIVDVHPCNKKNNTLNNTSKTFPKPQRLLARKDLWLPQEKTANGIEELSNSENTSLKNLAAKPGRAAKRKNRIKNPAEFYVSQATEKRLESQKEKANNKETAKNQVPAEASSGTKKPKTCKDLLNDSSLNTETSKYSIISKKMKLSLKEAQCETLSISSDSDDSILEVPIPPKAQPPLIELPDSDEDCDLNESKEKNRSRSGKLDIIKAAKKVRPGEKVTCEYDEPSTSYKDTNCTNESPGESQNIEILEGNNSDTICDIDTNLILNCSDPRRDFMSLEDDGLERRENFDVSGSTEKDTNRERSLSGGRAGTTRDSATFSGVYSFDKDLPQNQEPLDNSSGTNTADRTTDCRQSDSNNSFIENSEMRNEKSRRKRQKDAESRSLKEGNTSETPEKRRKRNTNCSSGSNSLTDYFFKPMTKEMQAFYDSPCGSENMNVAVMQSKMPKHPNNWKILNEDLIPRGKKRRLCLRCRNENHHGNRCPEQPTTPSCSMCGVKGHTATRCPKTMCLTCGRKYTSYRQTCCHCSKLACDMCHGVGHTRQNCPDLWRRFHNITTETLPAPRSISNTMKDPQHLSCCNCSKRGHDSTMCNQLRWSQHFPTPMFVSSYTEGPFYPEFQPDQDENLSGNIDVVSVPDNSTPIIQSTDERSETRLLFQCGNLDTTVSSTFTLVSKRLDTLPNVHLDGLISGSLTPTFIFKWLNHFTFNVKITQNSEEGTRLVVQAASHDLLHGVEKILMQWLTRTDLEKPYLEYDYLSYTNFKSSRVRLKNKLNELESAKDPKKFLTVVVKLAKELHSKSLNVIQNSNLSSSTMNLSPAGNTYKLQCLFDRLMETRSRLVMSLYGRFWVEGGEVTVRNFQKLVQQVANSKSYSIRQYMEAVYLYNEMFTYHDSEVLTRALKAATSTADPMDHHVPPLPQDFSTTNASQSSPIILDNAGESIIGNNNSAGPWPVDTAHQTDGCASDGSRMFTATDSLGALELSNTNSQSARGSTVVTEFSRRKNTTIGRDPSDEPQAQVIQWMYPYQNKRFGKICTQALR
ncbi:uncharacterized protein [Venturia canescens]|uniref:uncharacterized protein isoform X2 n=2 Tax=Venturia canescens TaxID=32260 RepID=UPI001C9BD229|nr:uncharacterized protein LOC122418910 isoform X2 [Venturia canescens]